MSLRFDDPELAFPTPSGETNEGTEDVAVAADNEAAPQSEAAKSKPDEDENAKKAQLDMTKIIILGAGILLIVFSLTAILLVATGSYGPVYNTPIVQMTGEMELEEMDDALVEWKAEYNDLTSEEATKLKNSLKSKLSKALEEEGVEVDDIVITELSPGPRKTIKKVFRQKRKKPKGRAASSIPEELSIDLGATGMVSPDMDQKVATYTEVTPDVQLVHVKYETRGIPAKNAALFTAAHGQWGSVSNMIEARMASTGMNVHIDSMEPTDKFMDNVLDISSQKSQTTTVAPVARLTPAGWTNSPLQSDSAAPDPSVKACTCRTTGMYVYAPDTMKCECPGPCIDGQFVWIYGGVNDIFRQCVPVCAAAYYAGIIGEAGGMIEVIDVGRGKIEAGNPRKSINPHGLSYIDGRFKIKAPGQTISVTPAPTTANPWNVASTAPATTATTSWWDTTTSTAAAAAGSDWWDTTASTVPAGDMGGAPAATAATEWWETTLAVAPQVGGVGGVGGGGRAFGAPKTAFTMHIQYNWGYKTSMKDLDSAEAKKIIDDVAPEIKKAVESLEFVVNEAKVKQIIRPPSKEGMIVAVDIICNHATNIPIAVKVERTKVGVVPKKIELAMKGGGKPKIRSFRYQKDFLNEMSKVMSQG